MTKTVIEDNIDVLVVGAGLGGTGAALGDENGVTVTITCSSGELPRLFTGTFTPAADGTVTIS